jgi:spore germination cell wall hydrolase CwlJ-like protein
MTKNGSPTQNYPPGRALRITYMVWLLLVAVGIWQVGVIKATLEAPFEEAARARHMEAEGRKIATAQMIARAIRSFRHISFERTPKSYFDKHWELSRNVLLEAGIEPFRGKVAVACITLNRVRSKAYPNTMKGVIWQTAQFSWTHLPKYAAYRGPKAQAAIDKMAARHPSWRLAWHGSRRAAAQVLSGASDCRRFAGIFHYMNPDYVSRGLRRQWRKGYAPAFRIGRHVFWKRLPVSARQAHMHRKSR